MNTPTTQQLNISKLAMASFIEGNPEVMRKHYTWALTGFTCFSEVPRVPEAIELLGSLDMDHFNMAFNNHIEWLLNDHGISELDMPEVYMAAGKKNPKRVLMLTMPYQGYSPDPDVQSDYLPMTGEIEVEEWKELTEILNSLAWYSENRVPQLNLF